MKIANIFSRSNIEAPQDFNVVTSFSDIIEGIPTLIVGYDYVNEHYPDFDITDICLGKDFYWTFRKTEKRDKYEQDLKWFITKVYADLTNELSYVFVDPIQYRGKTLVKIVKKIYSLKNIISYVNNEMIYIYGDKLIFGVDLRLLTYMGVDTQKIQSKIKAVSTVFLGSSDIFIEYKNTISSLDNKARYLPFLYSIRNGQNDTSSLIHISRES
jgi:hypothetical protein